MKNVEAKLKEQRETTGGGKWRLRWSVFNIYASMKDYF